MRYHPDQITTAGGVPPREFYATYDRIFVGVDDLCSQAQVLTDPKVKNLLIGIASAAGDTTAFSTLWALAIMRRLYGSAQIFDLDADLAEVMWRAKSDKILAEHLRLPAESFYLAWPDFDCGVRLYSETGEHRIIGAYIHRKTFLDFPEEHDPGSYIGTRLTEKSKEDIFAAERVDPKALSIVLACTAGDECPEDFLPMDDAIFNWRVALHQGVNVSELFAAGFRQRARLIAEECPSSSRKAVLNPISIEHADEIAKVVQMVLASCLYLSSPQADIEEYMTDRYRRRAEAIEQAELAGKKLTKQLKKWRMQLRQYRDARTVVKRLVHLPKLADGSRSAGKGTGRTMRLHLVNPHYQVYWMKKENAPEGRDYFEKDGKVAVPHFKFQYTRGAGRSTGSTVTRVEGG